MSETNETPTPTPGDLREQLEYLLAKIKAMRKPLHYPHAMAHFREGQIDAINQVLAILPAPEPTLVWDSNKAAQAMQSLLASIREQVAGNMEDQTCNWIAKEIDQFVGANKKAPPPVSDPVREVLLEIRVEASKRSQTEESGSFWEGFREGQFATANRLLALLPSPEPQRSASGGAGRECWILEERGKLKAPEGVSRWKSIEDVRRYIADVYEPGSKANPRPVRMVEAPAPSPSVPASPSETQGVREAAMAFAKAWAKWHEHTGLMLDDELIEASNGILDALGLDMEEQEDGTQKLIPAALSNPQPPPTKEKP